MSYMRHSQSFVDGSVGWNIFAANEGRLAILQGADRSPYLTYPEVKQLIAMLTEAVEEQERDPV